MARDDYADCLRRLIDDSAWTIENDDRGAWCTATPPGDAPLPTQGWKLHISATNITAVAVLERAVPSLVAHGMLFKVASDSRMLHLLNTGEAGPEQIGKFLTVYPGDADTAVAVGTELDRLLLGLHGPTVPSDRRLRDDSVLSYRYGGFVGRWIQLSTGQLVPAIERPDGELLPDLRRAQDAVPEWLADPFEDAGLVVHEPPRPTTIADRFSVLAHLSSNPRGGVDLALDIAQPRRCVLKRAVIDDDPLGPSARLAAERVVLEKFNGCAGIVASYGWFETDREHILVLEDIAGRDLQSEVYARRTIGSVLDVGWTIDTVLQLCTIVHTMHERGFAHRDLKPTNVIIRTDGTPLLVDFEFAAPLGALPISVGTPGYASPQQRAGGEVDVRDDVHSLGGILFMAATGVEPVTRPAARFTPDIICSVSPDVPASLAEVIARCLAASPDDRYPTVAALIAALDTLRGSTAAAYPTYGAMSSTTPTDARTARARQHLDAFVAAVRADAVDLGEGRVIWPVRQPSAPSVPMRDLGSGQAGIVLAVAALAAELGDAGLVELAHAGARWIDAAPRPEGSMLGGLHVGEGGVALTLARVGVLTGDTSLVQSALRRGAEVAALPHIAPDLFNGSAGRAITHLRLAQATGDEPSLDAAVATARHLVHSVVRNEHGVHVWEMPPEMGPHAYLGYAHGIAGIADALLEVGEFASFEPAVEMAQAVADDIVRAALHTSDGGIGWAAFVGGSDVTGPCWCHGAGGIGRFLMHLDRSGHLPSAHQPLVRASATAVARSGRGLSPIACHGLSGSIDFLVDLHHHDGDVAHLDEAWSLAELLEQFHVHDGDCTRSTSEQVQVVSPDLLFGYTGAAIAWLRLARPNVRGLFDEVAARA